jgi:succinyl-diaminopimelate desuccinylase
MRGDAPAAVRAAADLLPEAEAWLARWVAIPSVSGAPEHAVDLERAAAFAAVRLRRFAVEVDVVRTPAGPVVLARVRGRRPGALPVVVYGHLDVKPAGPGWHSPPFTPVRRGRRLVARGASDDKGQLLAHLVAIEAWAAVGGPPTDVLLVLDGAEEIGSPGLARVLARLRRPAAAVVVSDTRQAAPGVPSLTLSQRGLLTAAVTVDTGGGAVHAGRFGGAVRDPSLVLAAALGRADRLLARVPADRAYAPDDDDAVRRTAGRALHADALAARTTTRASLSVTLLRAGGTPGAVPRSASARLDVRLPPSVPPDRVLPDLVRELTREDGGPLRVTVVPGPATQGFVARHSAAVLAAVERACREGFGRPARRVSSGGSIPAVRQLEAAFGCSPLLLGFGPVDDGAHGPDEYLDLDDFRRAIRTSVCLIGDISGKSDPFGSGRHSQEHARHGRGPQQRVVGAAERDRAFLRGLGNVHD